MSPSTISACFRRAGFRFQDDVNLALDNEEEDLATKMKEVYASGEICSSNFEAFLTGN